MHSIDTAPADPDAPSPDPEDAARPHLALSLGGQLFLLDVAHVREILDIPAMSPLPGAGPDVLGLIDLRGRAVEVACLAARLGVPGGMAEGEGRILVLDTAGPEDRPLGLRVDRVERVVDIRPDALEPAPAGAACSGVRAIARLDGRLALVLDPAAALGGGPGLTL